MKTKATDLPIAREALGDMVRGEAHGGMTCAMLSFPKGTDFCPLLEGLEHDHCQCPHWGYVIEGRIKVTYQDGREETVEAGDVYYWPSGHTIVVQEDCRYIEFSPADQLDEVLDHVVTKMSS
ncbi:MAG: cupin domain-containing protein [Planctomycetota bacterium]